MNRENLKLLADYLAALPVKCAHFNMGVYFQDFEDYTSQDPAECGTVACAAGHGPVATGILKDKYDNESWAEYIKRVFDIDADLDAAYTWCFAGAWANADNTPQGAAKRIYWMLEQGVPVMHIPASLRVSDTLYSIAQQTYMKLSK